MPPATPLVIPISADYKSAQQQGREFLNRTKAEFETANAQLRESLAKGLVTPYQAAEKEAEILRAKNRAILAEVERVRAAGQLSSAGGAGYYQTVTAGLERVKSASSGVVQASRAVDAALGSNREVVQSLIYSFNGLSARAIGVNQSFGTLASALLPMAVGGTVTAGVLIGITALGTAWKLFGEQTTEAAKKAKEAAEKVKATLDDLQDRGDVSGLTQQAKTIFEGSASKGFKDGISGLRDQIAKEQQRLDDAISTRNVFVFNSAKKNLADLRAKLAPLEAEFADIQRRLLAAGPSLDRTRQPIVTTTTSTKADVRADNAAESARSAFRSAIAAQTPGNTDDVTEKLRKLVEQARAAKLSSDEIASLIDEFDFAQAKQMQAASDQLAASLRVQLADGIGQGITAARQALNAFDDEIALKRSLGITVPPELEQRARAYKLALADAADEAKRLDERLAEIGTQKAGGRGPIQTMRDLLEELDKADAAVQSTTKGTVAHEEALKRLQKVQAAVRAQQEGTRDAVQQTETTTQRLAGTIGAAASAAAGLATSFLGANSAITRTLVGVSSLAQGIEGISAAAEKAGGFSNLFKTSGGIASLASGIGGIIAGGGAIASALSGLFGNRESPEERAARRQQIEATQANVAALKELSTKIGSLNTSATGATTARVSSLSTDLANRFARNPALTQRDVGPNVLSALEQAGLSFEQFKAAAAALGVTVTDLAHLTVEDLRLIGQAADLLGNRTKALEESWEILGTSAADRFQQFLDVAKQVPETLENGTSALAVALDGIDTATEAGRAQARQLVRDAYAAGQITGDIAKEFLTLIDALAPVSDAANAAAVGLERVQQALSDIAMLGEIFGTSTVTQIREQLGALADAFPALGNQIRFLFEGIDFASEEGRTAFRDRVKAFVTDLLKDGLTEDERGIVNILAGIERSAEELGATASDATSGVYGLADAASALADAAESAVRSILASAQQAATDAKRLGKTPAQQSQAQADAFSTSLPGIGRVDVRDPKSIQRALDILRPGYASLGPGDLKDLFGGAIDFLMPLLDGLTAQQRNAALQPSSGDPNGTRTQSAVSTITEQTAVAMLATDRAQLLSLQHIEQMIAAYTSGAQIPIPAPAYAPAFAAAGGGNVTISAPITVSVTATIGTSGVPSPEQGYVDGYAQGVAAGIGSSLDAQLGGRLRTGNLFAGNRATSG